MTMKPKERMLTALNLEKPDRVPATLHQWQPYHLKYFMEGKSDIEAFRDVGLDAAITVVPFIDKLSEQWKTTTRVYDGADGKIIENTIETPEGILTSKFGSNEMTTWELEHLVKRDEDIYLIQKYRPVPDVDRKLLEKAYDQLGDDGIIRSFVIGGQGGCWQDACTLYGTEPMIYAAYDKPDWVHAFLNILLEQKLAYVEKLAGAKIDLVETGGGAASNNVISPSLHQEFCLPYDRKTHDALRSIGFKSVYHTCGGMTKILDLILQNGCDASETLSPIGVGGDITDLAAVVEKFAGKISMIGGLDQFTVLTEGTPEEVRKEVRRLFEAFGRDGGYMMSASDHFFHTPRENLVAYAQAAQECRY